MLKKMTSDSATGKWEKLSLNLIKEHVIHQFLLKKIYKMHGHLHMQNLGLRIL